LEPDLQHITMDAQRGVLLVKCVILFSCATKAAGYIIDNSIFY
jgi:hypothetical protein